MGAGGWIGASVRLDPHRYCSSLSGGLGDARAKSSDDVQSWGCRGIAWDLAGRVETLQERILAGLSVLGLTNVLLLFTAHKWLKSAIFVSFESLNWTRTSRPH